MDVLCLVSGVSFSVEFVRVVEFLTSLQFLSYIVTQLYSILDFHLPFCFGGLFNKILILYNVSLFNW